MSNVAWLTSVRHVHAQDVTCVLVSHDSGFLDKVCTNIIHYENRKLRFYRGNLSEFVKVSQAADALVVEDRRWGLGRVWGHRVSGYGGL